MVCISLQFPVEALTSVGDYPGLGVLVSVGVNGHGRAGVGCLRWSVLDQCPDSFEW